MNLGNGQVRTLVSGRHSSGLASDATLLYFAALDTLTIEKVPILGGTSVVLAHSTGPPYFLAACGNHLYWAASGGVYATSLPDGSGLATVPLFASSGNVGALVCDESGVYWTTGSSVVMCPHEGCGGVPIAIAPPQPGSWGITTDATAVYWVTAGDPAAGGGLVYKVAK